LYVITLAGSNAEPDDGLFIAVRVRDGSPTGLFDPSHLLYGWLSWAVYNSAHALGYNGGPLTTMQLTDSVLGATGVAVLWYLLRSITRDAVVATAGCGIVAFSYGYWFYSVSAEVYMLSALFIILALFAAYKAIQTPTGRSFALFGAANGFAVLGHSANVLFAFVALAALMLVARRIGLRGVVRCGFAYGLAACGIVVPAYVVAAIVLHLHTPNEVYDWYTAIASTGEWGHLTPKSLPKAALGIERALVGSHFLFAFDAVRGLIENHLSGQNPREEVFLVRNLSQGSALLLCLPFAAVLGGVGAVAFAWLNRPSLAEGPRALAVLCAVWLAAYVPFFLWWEPLNIEFWIVPWVALAILCAIPLADLRPRIWQRWRIHLVATVLGALFLVNLLGSVMPQASASNDYWRVRSDWYVQNTTSGDLILTDGYLWNSYLAYFTDAHALNVSRVFLESEDESAAFIAIEQQIEAALAHGRVYISGQMLFPKADTLSCCTEGLEATGIGGLVRDAYHDRLRLVEQGPREWVWQVDPAPPES
jgi:hypothetical protein